MLILQAAWLEGRVHIWGEVAAHSLTSYQEEDRVRGDKRLGEYELSPFDAGSALLSRIVETAAGSNGPARRHHARSALAWLPTWKGEPIPAQPGFWAADKELPDLEKRAAKLAPWRITVLPLSWFETCAILSVCANGPYLGRRLRAGSSLLAWSNLWRYGGRWWRGSRTYRCCGE